MALVIRVFIFSKIVLNSLTSVWIWILSLGRARFSLLFDPSILKLLSFSSHHPPQSYTDSFYDFVLKFNLGIWKISKLPLGIRNSEFVHFIPFSLRVPNWAVSAIGIAHHYFAIRVQSLSLALPCISANDDRVALPQWRNSDKRFGTGTFAQSAMAILNGAAIFPKIPRYHTTVSSETFFYTARQSRPFIVRKKITRSSRCHFGSKRRVKRGRDCTLWLPQDCQ